MRINHNIPALRTLSQLGKANGALDKSMQRLSSGLRINCAADDAAGLAISQKMDTQVRGLKQANRNAMDGISLIQTAEGALTEIHSMLQRMRELAVQASNGTYSSVDREAINDEILELKEEIKRICGQTEFNEMGLLSGKEVFNLHIGANEKQSMEVTIENVYPKLAELAMSGINFLTASSSTGAITKINDAIAKVSSIRSQLGAYQNRLEHAVANLDTSIENMTASLSRIQDADMAEEMSEYTRSNIISQAGTSMLAQANQRPQQILQLLQG